MSKLKYVLKRNWKVLVVWASGILMGMALLGFYSLWLSLCSIGLILVVKYG